MASLGGVVVNFMARTRDAIRDVDKFTDSLQDNEKASDDLDKALNDAEREFDQIGREISDLSNDLKKSTTGFKDVSTASDSMTRDLRQDFAQAAAGVKAGTDKIDHETDGVKTSMKEAGAEAGSEFIGNIAEGIGSGTANINEVMQGTLGGLTNLAASLGGPVGVAAGAAAAGIGLVFAAVKGQSEKAQAEIATLRDALKEVGSVSNKAARDIIFQTWVTEAEKVPGKIAAVNAAIKTAKVSADDFQRALAGDPAARARVTKALTDQYAQIQKTKRETGHITDEQKKYLTTTETILKDLGLQAPKVAAVKEEQEALNELTGTTAKKVKNWKGNLDDTATVMALIKRDAETIEGNHPVNFIVTTKDKTGRPVHLGPGQLALPGGVGAQSMSASQPVTVNVDARGAAAPSSPRELVALLESHQVRMGRTAGAPRARAW